MHSRMNTRIIDAHVRYMLMRSRARVPAPSRKTSYLRQKSLNLLQSTDTAGGFAQPSPKSAGPWARAAHRVQKSGE